MRERSILGIDLLLVVAVVTLMTIGVLFIYSSGVTADGMSFSREWLRQLVWIGFGLIIFVAVSSFDYARLREYAPYIFIAVLLILLGTLLFGRVERGARRWLGIGDLGVQPSEFAKTITILLLARFLENRRQSLHTPLTFAAALGIVLLPVGLILLQPDLGTAIVYIPIFLVMTYTAGARPSYVLFILLSGLVVIVLTVLPAWETLIHGTEIPAISVLRDQRLLLIVAAGLTAAGLLALIGLLVIKRSYFRWVIYGIAVTLTGLGGSVLGRRVLRDYQLMRLIVFLDPNVDPRGAGWHIIQSVTAVGSGGIAGKGWLSGTQSHLQYLPEQSTDFIFSILAEEWGFLGALAVFACFTIIIVRGLLISAKAKDDFASLVAIGIVTMFFFHSAVNIGMAIGIMPITGIPLPFVSYGGSSLWNSLIAVGLLMSIYQRRFRI